MTSMEKQQTALHFWSLIPPSRSSGCDGDPDAFGLHRPALGRSRLQGRRAGKCQHLCPVSCASLSWPSVTAITTLRYRDTWAGKSRPFPTAQVHPSDLAQPRRWGAVPPVGLHLQVSKQLTESGKHLSALLCHTLRNLFLPRWLCSDVPQWPALPGQQEGWACQTRAAPLTNPVTPLQVLLWHPIFTKTANKEDVTARAIQLQTQCFALQTIKTEFNTQLERWHLHRGMGGWGFHSRDVRL